MSWLQKIALTGKELNQQLWYHGTDNATAYSLIHDMLLRPRTETGNTSYIGSLSSIPNRVYLTNSISNAINYALLRTEKTKNQPVVLVIQPESLGCIHVDEDMVHQILLGIADVSNGIRQAVFALAVDYFNLDDFDDNKSYEELVRDYILGRNDSWNDDIEENYLKDEGVVPDEQGNYEFDETMHAAKEIAQELNDQQQKKAIEAFQALAHEGQVPASEIYLIPDEINLSPPEEKPWIVSPKVISTYPQLQQYGTKIDPRQLVMPFMSQ